jgi:hypothetical protein
MKKSGSVVLHLVPAIAASILATGCGPQPTHVESCVDGNSLVVDNKRCEEEDKTRAARSGYVPFYHWYYTPYGGSTHYAVGTKLSGGTTVRPAVASSTVVRGGFGSTGSGRPSIGS